MAALTFQATINANRSVSVAKSTADAIGSATAALVVDNTANKTDVVKAARALIRALNRENAKADAPADIPTTGTSVE